MDAKACWSLLHRLLLLHPVLHQMERGHPRQSDTEEHVTETEPILRTSCPGVDRS